MVDRDLYQTKSVGKQKKSEVNKCWHSIRSKAHVLLRHSRSLGEAGLVIAPDKKYVF